MLLGCVVKNDVCVVSYL